MSFIFAMLQEKDVIFEHDRSSKWVPSASVDMHALTQRLSNVNLTSLRSIRIYVSSLTPPLSNAQRLQRSSNAVKLWSHWI